MITKRKFLVEEIKIYQPYAILKMESKIQMSLVRTNIKNILLAIMDIN